MTTKLPSDATIISVYDKLTDKKQAAAAYNEALQCAKSHTGVGIRIGITGSGQKPCYRVVYQDVDGIEHIFGSWWDMGDKLSTIDAVNSNWSTAMVTVEELEAFLRQRTGYAGPRPRS